MPSDSEGRDQAVDRALSVANLHRRRGDWEAAWRALDDAATLAPEDPGILLLMGDFNLDQEQWEAAAQCFRRALELGGPTERAELGLGRALAELAVARQTGAPRANPLLKGRTPQAAAAWSLFVPGLGQVYADELRRGLSWMAVAAPVWVAAAWQYFAVVNSLSSQRRGTPVGELIGPGFWVCLILLALVHVAAAIDAQARLTAALREFEQP